MNRPLENTKGSRKKENQIIAVRIQPPVSEAVIRMAQDNKRPRQWQVDLILRAGLEALGEKVAS